MQLKQLLHWLESDFPNRVEVLPSPFSDSSHHIVFQYFDNHTEVVKGVRDLAQQTPIWQGIDHLFGVTLSQQIAAFEISYPWLAEYTDLQLPVWLHTYEDEQHQACAVRSSFLTGHALQAEAVQPLMVEQLAQHLGGWHRLRSTKFGGLSHPQGEQSSWPKRLESYLQTLPETCASDRQLKQQSLQQLAEQQAVFLTDPFGVIMTDLRWDQFLADDNRLVALTDLDAVLYGPVALEWVLLEVILTEQQAQQFLEAYPGEPPRLKPVRSVYRAVLSQFQVFGEQNAQAWLDFPCWFD